MVRWVAVVGLLLAAGCGRIWFDPIGDGGADAPSDAALSAIAQRAYVKASNTGAGDEFGGSVALSADGSTLAVGAFAEDSAATGVGGNQADNATLESGAIYVFQ